MPALSRRHLLLNAFQRPSPRPNILLLFADDLGYGDLPSYGAPDVKTPHLDRLAREGVRFTQFYSNAPECTPSRCALLTGRYQQRVGGLECAIGVGNVGRYDEATWLEQRGQLGLPASEPTLAQVLKSKGYQTACFGKWHLGYTKPFSPLAHGFEKYFGILGGNANYFTHAEQDGAHHLYEQSRHVRREGYLTDLFADAAIGYLKQLRRQKPFFLYLPFNAPHTPIQGPNDQALAHTITAQNFNRGSRATYAAMIEHMDKRIGDVLAALDASGQANNTLVLFLSDNGAMRIGRNAPFRGFKSEMFEGGIRVPAIARFPGRFAPQTQVSTPALSFDWTATFLDYAQAPAPRPLDGLSLRPLLEKQTPLPARPLFWRYKRLAARRLAYRNGPWKYIRHNQEEFVFHLDEDPAEQNNLLARQGPFADRARQAILTWEKAVAAPRLRSFSPPQTP